MAPNSPNTAPEAPTEMLDRTKREDITLPPSPAMMYSSPILTVRIVKEGAYYIS